MTADLRHSLRLAIDRAVRARIDWDAELRCVGCGVEQIDSDTGDYRYVPGCGTCSDRASKHRRRDAEREPQLAFEVA